MSMEPYPAATAMQKLMSFAIAKLFLSSASKGSDECPSWDMQLARSTGNGTIPPAKSDTKTICGPDSGMSPIAAARSIITAVFSLIQLSRSMNVMAVPMTASTPKVHRKMTGACLRSI